MEDTPAHPKDIGGDLIGAGVEGTGNLVGKEIHYSVQGGIFNINNPSSELLQELTKILAVRAGTSINQDSSLKRSSTLADLRTVEKHIEEILYLLRKVDGKDKAGAKEIIAGELYISRINLLLKRSIVLVEQANRYWNVTSKSSDINMYKTKLKEAYSLLREAAQLDRFNTEVLLFMAKVQGKLTPTNLMKMRETLFQVQNLLEIPHDNAEKFQLAQATFLLSTSDTPIDEDMLQDSRIIFHDLGRRDWVRLCEDLLQPESGKTLSSKSWYSKGLALDSLGRYKLAIECFDKAIEIDANNSKTWNSKGSVFGSIAQYELAIECFDKAIEIGPISPNILKNKGTSLHYLGKYDEAIKCFDQAIEIDHDDIYTWCGKGLSLDYLGKYDEAIKCFDQAIEIDSENDDAWYNKGVALDYLKKYDAAIECYDKSIDLNPDNAVAWYGKALVHKSLGNGEKAQAYFNKAKQLGMNT
jgi:tetratricopeptide (TPR) repeat protein